MSAEAIIARQHELAKLRALMFYEEQKRRRQNKIKSKAYRRLKKKADMKRGEAERADLEDRDPEAAAMLAEEEARMLAKERMTLKHRAGKGIGGSNWVKRVLTRAAGRGGADANLDAHSKAELLQHLRRAQELQQRMRERPDLGAGDEGSDDSDADSLGGDGATLSKSALLRRARDQLLEEAEAGSSEGEFDAEAAGIPKGILGLKFMQDALRRQKEQAREDAAAMAGELEAEAAGGRRGSGGLASDWGAEGFSDGEPGGDGDSEEEGDEDVSAIADLDDQTKRGARKAGQQQTKKGAAANPVTEAAAAVGRRVFGSAGTAAAARPRGKGMTDSAIDAALSGLGTASAAATTVGAAPAAAQGNAWLSQGGVSYFAMGEKDKAAADPAEGESNPWLAAGTFDSAGGGTGIGRHKATQRARDLAAGGDTTMLLDVAGSLSALAAPKSAKATAEKPVPAGKKQAAAVAAAGSATAAVKAAALAAPASLKVSASKTDKITAAASAGEQEPAAAASSKQQPSSAAPGLTQDELIRRAFAGYGAATAEDLAAARDEDHEDKEREEADLARGARTGTGAGSRRGPVEDPSEKAGWGTWAGLGAASAEEQRRKATEQLRRAAASSGSRQLSRWAQAALAKEEERKAKKVEADAAAAARKSSRRDSGLSKVVISEKRDKKLAQHQADVVPFPFTSREAYERSLRNPVGAEWNTLSTTAQATRPEWTSRAGLIIQPLAYTDVRKETKRVEEDAAAMVAASGMGAKTLKGAAGAPKKVKVSIEKMAKRTAAVTDSWR
jgi:U3 small nucleolar RNA-associated protein 14